MRFFRRAIVVDIVSLVEQLLITEKYPFQVQPFNGDKINTTTYDILPAESTPQNLRIFPLPSQKIFTCNHTACNHTFKSQSNLNKHEKLEHRNCFRPCPCCFFWSDPGLLFRSTQVTESEKHYFLSSTFDKLCDYFSEHAILGKEKTVKDIVYSKEASTLSGTTKGVLQPNVSLEAQTLGEPEQKYIYSEIPQTDENQIDSTFLSKVESFLESEISEQQIHLNLADTTQNTGLESKEGLVNTEYRTLLENVVALFKNIPRNSPVRTSLIRTLFVGIPVNSVSTVLQLSPGTIYRALSKNYTNLSFYLREL